MATKAAEPAAKAALAPVADGKALAQAALAIAASTLPGLVPAPPPTKIELDVGPLLAAKAASAAAHERMVQATDAYSSAAATTEDERKKLVGQLLKALAHDLDDNVIFVSDEDAVLIAAAAQKTKCSPQQFARAALAAALKA